MPKSKTPKLHPPSLKMPKSYVKLPKLIVVWFQT